MAKHKNLVHLPRSVVAHHHFCLCQEASLEKVTMGAAPSNLLVKSSHSCPLGRGLQMSSIYVHHVKPYIIISP